MLAVVVRGRRAVCAVVASIRSVGKLRGVVHSWSGSRQQAEQLWYLGFLLGIGGPVTYERARRLRELVAGMPLEHLLLETDAPDQPDSPIRGQRNEPARLRTLCETSAEPRGVPVEGLSIAPTRNAETSLGLRPSH